MWALSDAAKAALVAGVQSYEAKAELLSPNGDLLVTLDVLDGGSVTVDGTAAVRRMASSIGLSSQSLVPRLAGDLLDPRAGNRLRLSRGIALSPQAPSNEPEWIPLGTFLLSDPQMAEDNGGLKITVTGYDLSQIVARNAWIGPYSTSGSVASVIGAMVADRAPALTVVCSGTGPTLGSMSFGLGASSSGNDPWADVTTVAAQASWQVAPNPLGVITAGPIPSAALNPSVWTFSDADPDCTVTAWQRDLSDSDTYTGVLITSENTGNGTSGSSTVLSSLLWDTDPNSPTYYLGPYGKKPKLVSLPGLTVQADADAAAVTQLATLKGLTEIVTITAAPNPALDVGDVITATRSTLAISANYVISAISQPLGSGLMQITCTSRGWG